MSLDEISNKPFSHRHGYNPGDREITIRQDAPREFREALLQIARAVGLGPSALRDIICQVLKKLPDSSNWSEYPNIWGEVQSLILGCEWFRVYDITEAIHTHISKHDATKACEFVQLINEYFKETGIGWQLINGLLQTRGPEFFESSVQTATELLSDTQRSTSSHELHESLQDLSRRPNPDITGAIQHAMAALECTARDICGEPKATLGDIVKKNPLLFPKPLDEAVSKIWGYASEMARHLQEGRIPNREEAELVVGLAAICTAYIVNKQHK